VRERFEFGRALHVCEEPLTQRDVVGDHAKRAVAAGMTQAEPHLQCTEPARVLRTIVDIVHRFLAEVVIGRVVGEGIAQPGRVAHERAARLDRRVHPLVRIHRQRIRMHYRAQVRRCAGYARSKRTVCTIHVEPHTQLATEPCNLVERIDRTGTDGTCRRRHHHRPITRGAVALDRFAQGRHVHALVAVHRDPANRVRSKPGQVRPLLYPRVRLH